MKSDPHILARSLRRSFDESFARVASTTERDEQGFLAIRVNDARFAIRVSEIAGLFTDLPIVGFPSAVPAFSGLVSVRGSVLPAYDLAALVAGVRAEQRRWLILVAAHALALACEDFEGQLRIATSKIIPAASATSKTGYIRELVQSGESTLPVIHLGSVLEHIKSMVGSTSHEGAGSR